MQKGLEVIKKSESGILKANEEAWENMGIIAKGDAAKDKKDMEEKVKKGEDPQDD